MLSECYFSPSWTKVPFCNSPSETNILRLQNKKSSTLFSSSFTDQTFSSSQKSDNRHNYSWKLSTSDFHNFFSVWKMWSFRDLLNKWGKTSFDAQTPFIVLKFFRDHKIVFERLMRWGCLHTDQHHHHWVGQDGQRHGGEETWTWQAGRSYWSRVQVIVLEYSYLLLSLSSKSNQQIAKVRSL